MAKTTAKHDKRSSRLKMDRMADDLRQSMCGQGDLSNAVRATQLRCQLGKAVLNLSDWEILELETETSGDNGPGGGQPVLSLCVRT